MRDWGAFVELAEHVEGLVRADELAASAALGDVLTARVLSVDVAQRKIALSTKPIAPPDDAR